MGKSHTHRIRSSLPRKNHHGTDNMSIPRFNPRWGNDDDKYIQRKRKGIALGYKWSRLRRKYLQENPYCNRCSMLAEEVHHIIPRAVRQDLIYEWTNLMSLCKSCHMKEHGMGGTNGTNS